VTTCASRGGFWPTSASEPAVVSIASAVAMLSLISTETHAAARALSTASLGIEFLRIARAS